MSNERLLTNEEINAAYIKACTSNELCDETNGSRGVAMAQDAKTAEIVRAETLKEVRGLLVMVREELCFGGDWETARTKIDEALKQGRMPE